MVTKTEDSTLRLDKWRWAARFFTTRVLAAAAVAGGKINLNSERVKAAKAIRPAQLRIIQGCQGSRLSAVLSHVQPLYPGLTAVRTAV